MRPLVVALVTCASLASVASVAPAAADTPTDTQAHEAYERGTVAYRRKDYATAAREYAAADALSPNPVALQAAIDAAVQADDPVLGVQLLDRAHGSPRTNALVTTMLAAEQRFARRTGRIQIACPAQPCLATIDGAAVDPGQPAIVRVGAHSVMVEGGGAATTRAVTVSPDETLVVGRAPDMPAAPPAASDSAPASSIPLPAPQPTPTAPAGPLDSGLSPAWFFVGLGATVVAGGMTIGSGIDTASKHSTFNSCRLATCGQLTQDASAGQSAQTRTNVLIGVTAALGIATAVTLPFVRWHGAQASAGLGMLAFDGCF